MDPRESTRGFFEAVLGLGGKLGPILFQLPPRWHADPPRLAAFLAALPVGHRYAFEFRDETWFTDAVRDRLAHHNAALCIYDLDRKQSPDWVTADFVYVRLHGPQEAYRGRYGAHGLREWSRKLRAWRGRGCDVYCYFDNDENGNAANDASCLIRLASKS